jgi:sensory rhodopsin
MALTTLINYTFLLTFLVMAAGALYFALERDALPREYRAASTISAVYLFIAASNYYFMRTVVGQSVDLNTIATFPTELRYLDWLITTPLMLVMFTVLLGARNKAVLVVLVVADMIMIGTGYVGEVILNRNGPSTEAWAMFLVGCLAYLVILYMLFSAISEAQEDALEPIANGLSRMKMFIIFGWLIYPLGFVVALLAPNSLDAKLWRELIYNIADGVNKVGFAVVTVAAAKAVARDREIKDAIARI